MGGGTGRLHRPLVLSMPCSQLGGPGRGLSLVYPAVCCAPTVRRPPWDWPSGRRAPHLQPRRGLPGPAPRPPSQHRAAPEIPRRPARGRSCDERWGPGWVWAEPRGPWPAGVGTWLAWGRGFPEEGNETTACGGVYRVGRTVGLQHLVTFYCQDFAAPPRVLCLGPASPFLATEGGSSAFSLGEASRRPRWGQWRRAWPAGGLCSLSEGVGQLSQSKFSFQGEGRALP